MTNDHDIFHQQLYFLGGPAARVLAQESWQTLQFTNLRATWRCRGVSNIQGQWQCNGAEWLVVMVDA